MGSASALWQTVDGADHEIREVWKANTPDDQCITKCNSKQELAITQITSVTNCYILALQLEVGVSSMSVWNI